MQRPSQFPRLEVGHRGEAGGDEALHVAGTARIEVAAVLAQRERIGGPGLALDRHGIDVAGQSDAAGSLWPDDRVNVGLLPGRVGADTVGDAVRIEVAAHEVDQLQVGVAAGGVERNQPGEHLGRGHAIGRGVRPGVCRRGQRRGVGCIHAASLYGPASAATTGAETIPNCTYLGVDAGGSTLGAERQTGATAVRGDVKRA